MEKRLSRSAVTQAAHTESARAAGCGRAHQKQAETPASRAGSRSWATGRVEEIRDSARPPRAERPLRRGWRRGLL